jgi:hypothetical protein
MTPKVVLVFASARESLVLFRRLLDAVASGLTWEIQCGGRISCCTDLIIFDWDFGDHVCCDDRIEIRMVDQ